MAYCTVDSLKEYLGISGAGDDSLMEKLVESATQWINNYTGRTFEVTADSTRYFDGRDNVDDDMLYLDRDICSITTVTNGDGDTVASTEYVTQPRNDTPYYALKIKESSTEYWTWNTTPENAISITGKWGYSTEPDETIRWACRRLSAYWYRQKDNTGDLDRPMVVGVYSTVLPAEVPRDVTLVLEPYLRRVF